MSILSRLFGRSSAPAPKPEARPETHKDFTIFAEPIQEGSRWRVAARIEKEVDGELKSHSMIRAATCESAEAAEELTLRKARQTIDQLGETLFR